MEYYFDIYCIKLLKPFLKKTQQQQKQANTISSQAGLNCV